jgi:hypothetical protein
MTSSIAVDRIGTFLDDLSSDRKDVSGCERENPSDIGIDCQHELSRPFRNVSGG